MSFSIQFLNLDDYSPEQRKYYLGKKHNLCLGEITIGGFDEVFESSLAFWSKNEYEVQWKDALARIVKGSRTSCLITTMNDPRRARFLTWWPLYRDGYNVIVQNHLFFIKDAKGQFDPQRPYSFVKEYERINRDGQEISEWITTVVEIEEFLDRVKK